MKLNADYWNDRYRELDTRWDAGSVTTPLKTYFDQIKDKSISILIPGAGNSYEAEYLYQIGFKNIFVLDYAPLALKNFSDRNPEFPSSHLLQEDFFKHQGMYDLIIEQTFFCALDISLRSAYAKHMHALLKPEGKLVGVLFNDDFGNDLPPFGGTKEEYTVYFEPYFNFNVLETCYNSIKPREGRELFINFSKKIA
jgi:methyl halide transferase